MAQAEPPENARQREDDRRSNDEMEHEPARLTERLDEQSRRNVGDEDHWNEPAENNLEQQWVNRVGVTGDVEKIEVAVHQTLCAHDPETDRGQTKHNGIMNRNAKDQRGQVKQDRYRIRHKAEFA